jgi:hypothetical protein
LSKRNELFDKCGVYDIRSGTEEEYIVIEGTTYEVHKSEPDAIEYPKKNPNFANVIRFFSWYEIPAMKDFGIIIIDD